MKILLIARPWKGGLGRYFHRALQEVCPTAEVEWLPTRPRNREEQIRFRRDPADWWGRVVEAVNAPNCSAAIFISHCKELAGIRPSPRNLLYLVDDARLTAADAAPYGRVFLSDPGYANDLRAATGGAAYGGVLPFGLDPSIHKPTPPAARKSGICFIGNRDEKRDAWLESLFEDGFHPLIVGNYFLQSRLFWRRPWAFRPAVSNEAMGGIYARRRVALNIHARVVRQGTNMRTFECAGYEVPQIVEWREGIEAYFEPEKEIITVRNREEMPEKIRAILRDESRARRMAEAARKRALAAHTYVHRVKVMLKDVLPGVGQ